MLAPLGTTDPSGNAVAPPNRLETRLLPLLRDPRDIVFLRAAARMALVIPPLALGMYLMPARYVLMCAVPYVALIFALFAGRYTLMLHAVSHRLLFKKDHEWLNHVVPGIVGPFLGQTPTAFYVHHIGMHHPENNLENDLSCTLPYQRDRLSHFLHYWARFFVFGHLHLSRYLIDRGRTRLLRRFWAGELVWFASMVLLLWLNPVATAVVFLFPTVLMRFLMMTGNFAQHAFVDPADAANPYRNSTCLTETAYNHQCFNDGYHIVHHIKPALHWTEMATWYVDNREEFARQDAVVFQGMPDNTFVWLLLMLKSYGRLADRMVDFHGRTREERITFLQSRVRASRGAIPSVLVGVSAPA